MWDSIPAIITCFFLRRFNAFSKFDEPKQEKLVFSNMYELFSGIRSLICLIVLPNPFGYCSVKRIGILRFFAISIRSKEVCIISFLL